MLQQRQYYRKNLVTNGLVFLAGQERNIILKNLSVKGFLAEFEDREIANNLDEIFAAIKTTTIIDFYLPEMQLVGDAELIRVDLKGSIFFLALEFRNFSYAVNPVLYQRKAYRKQMIETGNIRLKGQNYQFNTCNISQDGLLIHLPEKLFIEQGAVTGFDFLGLDLQGEGKVVWVDEKDDQTLIGLQFLSKDKINIYIKGIPRFAK